MFFIMNSIKPSILGLTLLSFLALGLFLVSKKTPELSNGGLNTLADTPSYSDSTQDLPAIKGAELSTLPAPVPQDVLWDVAVIEDHWQDSKAGQALPEIIPLPDDEKEVNERILAAQGEVTRVANTKWVYREYKEFFARHNIEGALLERVKGLLLKYHDALDMEDEAGSDIVEGEMLDLLGEATHQAWMHFLLEEPQRIATRKSLELLRSTPIYGALMSEQKEVMLSLLDPIRDGIKSIHSADPEGIGPALNALELTMNATMEKLKPVVSPEQAAELATHWQALLNSHDPEVETQVQKMPDKPAYAHAAQDFSHSLGGIDFELSPHQEAEVANIFEKAFEPLAALRQTAENPLGPHVLPEMERGMNDLHAHYNNALADAERVLKAEQLEMLTLYLQQHMYEVELVALSIL